MSKRCKGCKLQPCASWCSRGKPRVVDGHSHEHEALRQAIRDEGIRKLREEWTALEFDLPTVSWPV